MAGINYRGSSDQKRSSSRSSSRWRWEGSAKLAHLSPVETFACSVCRVSAPCQFTLNKHLEGKDHLKRMKELQESRKQRGEEEKGGYRTGPLEMTRLGETDREELERLRRHNHILKMKLEGFQREESVEELERLRRQVRFCRENHGKQEHFYKREAESEDQKPCTYTSTSFCGDYKRRR